MSSDIPPSQLLNFIHILQVPFAGFDSTILFEILSIFILLVINGMVASSEVAFFALSPAEKEEIKNDDNESNDRILDLLEKPRYVLSTVLIVISLLNITIVLLSHLVIGKFFPEDMGAIQIGSYSIVPHYIEEIITIAIDIFFILLFVDVIPITFAQSNKIRVATFMALPLSILVKFFYPLSYFMVNASAFIEKKIRRYTDIDTNEIEQAIEMTADKNTTQEDIKVLKGIVHFGEITARQIMKPRMDIYALDYSWDFEKLIEYVREGGYSRLPVYIDSLDNIKGVLHVKDLLQHIDKDASFDWHSMIHEALYIPEGKKIDDLLKEIQSTRKHLAIVVDEHGGTCGIITLEDIVEEVLGEIKDEFDDDEEFTSNKVNDNTYIFEGKVLINDVCKIINADVNEFEEVRGEADSIAGLILEIAGKMPQKNEVFSFENYSFRVLNIEKNRIRRIEIKILDKE